MYKWVSGVLTSPFGSILSASIPVKIYTAYVPGYIDCNILMLHNLLSHDRGCVKYRKGFSILHFVYKVKKEYLQNKSYEALNWRLRTLSIEYLRN